MDLISSLILLLIVIVLVFLFVSQPFTHRRHTKAGTSQVLSTLLAERDRVLNSLKDLDFDNSLGKIPADTYPQQRLALVQQGAEILRQIDQIPPVSEVVPAVVDHSEDQVEAMLSARRLSRTPDALPVQDQVESLVADRRKLRTLKTDIFCTHCGRPLIASDRFCPRCGQPVQ